MPGKLRSGTPGGMSAAALSVAARRQKHPKRPPTDGAMCKMGSITQCLRSPLRTPTWAGSAAGHCPPHRVLATSSSQPLRQRARVTQPPAPRPCSALPDSRGLRPHLFPAAECPLVVTSEVFEDSEEETGIGWTPMSRARGQGGCLRTKTCCPREPRGGQGQEAR